MALNASSYASLAILLGSLFVSNSAWAKCKSGYYRDGLTRACLPKGGKIVKDLDPTKGIKTALKIGNAVVQGDVKEITRGVGELIINNSCPLCSTVGKGLASDKDVAMAEELVGRGFLFYVTGEPLFMVVDIDSSTATQVKPRIQQPGAASSPKSRPQKTFTTSNASCIVKEVSGAITAGWASAPQLTDASSKTSTTYPEVDLWPGDLIVVTAPECPKQSVKGSQASVTSASISYEWSNVVPGTGQVRMKYMLGGKAKE